MRLWQRFASSKKARIVALAILGVAIFSYAAIILVSEIFGAGEDAGKVYHVMSHDRVLLLNADTNTKSPISWQGYNDTWYADDDVFWMHSDEAKPTTYKYLQKGSHHQFWANINTKLWQLNNCRYGNTYTDTSNTRQTYQNYLPFSSTARRMTSSSSAIGTRAYECGHIVMQNTPDAQVISSCYADGIGTIYFDCVNGFTGYKDGKISVEVAYGVWKTNEAGVVVSREFPKDIEFYADGTPVPPDEAGAHEITVDVDGNVQTNEYGRCVWVKVNMTGKYWSGSEGDIAPTKELKLELPLTGQNAGNMDNFYRVWAPIQDASVNPDLAQYCRGPMRFRIKRLDNPVDLSIHIVGGDLDGSNIQNYPLLEESVKQKYNALILIDNVIASFPAMKAEAVARGEYAKGLTDRGNVGWIDVLSTRCPAAGESGLKVRAGLNVSSNTPPEQGINYDASTWVTKATWVYRWRYLNQVTNDWREVTLLPGENGLESTEELTMESRVGDIEFYYNADLNAPYYGYVDYSGSTKLTGTPGYTERIKSVEARFNPGWLGQEGLPLTLPSLGTDFFFRLREGKSEQLSYKLEIRQQGKSEITESEFFLTGDNTWRTLFKTETNESAKGTWEFRVIGANPRNYWGGNATETMPVTGQRLFQAAAMDDCWTAFNVDAATGYLMFQLNEDPLVADQMSYSIVHADYQDFTHWNSAKKEYFVGTYTDNEKKIGASSGAKEYAGEHQGWNATSAENDALWTEKFLTGTAGTPATGWDGYAGYYTFPSAYTPNGWEAGQGMWVCREYRKDETKNGGDMALQMEGQGRGYLEFNNSSAPHGLESVSFNARVAQFSSFRDFSYYSGKQISTMKDYLFTTKVIMAENATTDAFDGSGTVSLLGYYQPNVGGYEVRAERVDGNVIRLSIYKWYSSGGQIISKEVCRSKTSIAFTSQSYLQKHGSGYYGSMLIHCKTQADRTIVVGGIINDSLGLSASASGKSHFLVKFEDTAADRFKYGECGFDALNCPAKFYDPLYYSGTPTYGSGSWSANSDAQFKSYIAHYYTKTITFPGSSTKMFQEGADAVTYTDWSINVGKFEVVNSGMILGVKAIPTSSPMEVQVKTSGASRWQTIGTTNIVGFGLKEYKFPVYSKDDAAVRLKMGGTIYDVRSDVVIDDVKLRQWRGESYHENSVNFPSEKLPSLGCPSNYVYLTSWVNADGDVRTIDLQPMRSRKSDLVGIRAPLMDGYDGRGIGLGMFSFSYENAHSNCVLRLQYAPMNGASYLASYTESVDTNDWTDVAVFDFSTMSDKERASGTLSHYLGMHGFQGVMRLIVDPQVVADSQDAAKNPKGDLDYGKITLTSFLTRDEPVLDDRSWWGWNLRSSDAPAERILYDGVASEAKLALALNNSITDNIDPNADIHDLYPQHVPFVQSPTFATNIVGEISFKARKLNAEDGDAVVAILGARDSGVTLDSEWKHLRSFVVSNAYYESFTYKTDPGQDYGAFRIAVIGVDGVKGERYLENIPEGAQPLRVLVDEVIVSEAVRARIGFRDVAAFRSGLEHEYMISNATDKVEQPLCKESWGVQGEVFIAQLADEVDMSRGFEVKLHWFDGMSPWGFENWKTNSAAKSAWLSRALGTGAHVFRSSYISSPAAVIPPSMTAGVVQYMLEVQYYTASGAAATNFLTAADWNDGKGPAWYSPIDYNAGRSFSAYNILDTVSPGWAWINEINVFGSYDNLWRNSDDSRQYVEVAMPAEADLTGWQLRFLDASPQSGVIYTNTVATFGTVNLPGTKPNLKNMASNCVFMVVGCPDAARSGSLSSADGEIDGVWSFENKNTSAFAQELVVPIYPVAMQLVRPSGIIEHELIMIGTNFWEGTGNDADMFKPDEYIAFYNASENGGRFIYAGAEKGGDECSLSVLSGSGAESNDWSHAVVRTPGRINVGQAINPLHPTPFGSAIMIYSNLGSSGHLSQKIGGEFVKQNEIIILRKGSGEGTNLVYKTDNWYEMGSVKVDGAAVQFATVGSEPRTYSVNVGAGSSNDVITVDAEAVMEKRLETEYGLTRDNRYTKAVLDWLSKGTDVYGNAWANADAGKIKLAEYWPWVGDEDKRQTLPLTAMYWLDIDPTAGDWVFRAGTTKITGPVYPSASVTNIRLSVSMMITNKNTSAAHAPYTLRGLEPGSSSHTYDPVTSDYGWTSVTFKVTGTMLKNFSDTAPRENRVPLRWFVFGEYSFGGADGFTTTIDVRDPWASDSPATGYGYQEWLRQNAGKPLPVIGYAWDIDERLKPVSVDKLKADSTFKNQTY